MEPVTFAVPGRPVAKLRCRQGRGGRLYVPRRVKEYEEMLSWRARMAFDAPLEGEVALALRFYYRDRRATGDLDNCIKTVCDALNGVAYRDDRQVAAIRAERVISALEEERVEITVRPLPARRKK